MATTCRSPPAVRRGRGPVRRPSVAHHHQVVDRRLPAPRPRSQLTIDTPPGGAPPRATLRHRGRSLFAVSSPCSRPPPSANPPMRWEPPACSSVTANGPGAGTTGTPATVWWGSSVRRPNVERARSVRSARRGRVRTAGRRGLAFPRQEGGGSASASGTTGSGAHSMVVISGRGSRWRWRAVRTTLASNLLGVGSAPDAVAAADLADDHRGADGLLGPASWLASIDCVAQEEEHRRGIRWPGAWRSTRRRPTAPGCRSVGRGPTRDRAR